MVYNIRVGPPRARRRTARNVYSGFQQVFAQHLLSVKRRARHSGDTKVEFGLIFKLRMQEDNSVNCLKY